MTQEAAWSRVLAQYWPCAWLRTPEDATVAATEIRDTFRRQTPDNDELVQAIRWLAGPENKQARCPTLRELIRAVCILRKRDREADAVPVEDCATCRGSGWAYYWPDWDQGWDMAEYILRPVVSVPCVCSLGQRCLDRQAAREKLTGAQVDSLREMGRQAVTQAAAYERATPVDDGGSALLAKPGFKQA